MTLATVATPATLEPTPEASAPISLVQSDLEQPNAAVLFHGLTGTPFEMRELASELHHKGFDVFVPCLSGHGESIAQLRSTPLDAWFSDVDTVFKSIRAGGYKRVAVGGLSFGGLLSLYAAAMNPQLVSALILASVPLKFRSARREALLGSLALLPDPWLDRLPVVVKRKFKPDVFQLPRYCYGQHSIGAAARLVKLRRRVLPLLPSIKAPIFVLQDPADHHVSPEVPALFRKNAKAPVTSRWYVGGHHDLTLGGRWREVAADAAEFCFNNGRA